MAFTTYTGPIRAGTVKEGANNNTGLVTLATTSSVAVSGVSKTSGATAVKLFTIPANSKILNFTVDVTTALTGNSVSDNTVTLGNGTASNDQLSTAIATGVSVARVAQATVDAAITGKATLLDNVGTSDYSIYGLFTATTGNPTAGVIKVTCTYIQRGPAGVMNPTSA